MKRRGFTLIELLVVVAIIALLIAILLPSLGKARELSNRSVCAANLRGIAQSLVVYANDQQDAFPMVPHTANGSTYGLTTNTTAQYNSPDSTMSGGNAIYTGANTSLPINVMQDMWLLSLRGQVAPKQFQCKSDPNAGSASQVTNTTGLYFNNFNTNNGPDASGFSYSYSVAFPLAGATGATAGWWRNTNDASIALLSDIAPMNGTPAPPNNTNESVNSTSPGAQQRLANSNNHGRDGQNVGYADGHAEFARTVFVGQSNSSIFGIYPGVLGSGNATPVNPGNVSPALQTGSQGAYNIVMVPIADLTNGGQRK